MADESHFMVFISSGVGLADAAQALRGSSWFESASTAADVDLAVRATAPSSSGGRPTPRPMFRIGLSLEPHVRLEAEELAEEHQIPGLGACHARFEVFFDDLEEVLDESNTLIELQALLQDLANGFVINAWNGSLTLPEGEPCTCPRCR